MSSVTVVDRGGVWEWYRNGSVLVMSASVYRFRKEYWMLQINSIDTALRRSSKISTTHSITVASGINPCLTPTQIVLPRRDEDTYLPLGPTLLVELRVIDAISNWMRDVYK